MIRTLVLTENLNFLRNIPLKQISGMEIKWYWVDFDSPNENEMKLLDRHFHFHPLAIEDCLHYLQRPKLDYYETYNFFVLHALNQNTLDPEEIDIFVGSNYIVSFHLKPSREIEHVWQRIVKYKTVREKGPSFIAYLITDTLVDQYFPAVHQIEDHLNQLNNNLKSQSVRHLINEVFNVRVDLLKLRGLISSMRDVLNRIVNSGRLDAFKDYRIYFKNIHHHLVKLSVLIESGRDLTSDMQDSYLSVISYRMNTVMMTLTIITSIFIPLTFISSIYGMNFKYMPELTWRYGYFMVLGVMAIVGIGMFLWCKSRGWFDVYK
ncbi:magnesium/cobalt transporter CorA [Sporolactobacillus sp. THM7-7]|nr:magnesium/cobalt transporter CorA [Sporolactobacillus sp. THM7-7]